MKLFLIAMFCAGCSTPQYSPVPGPSLGTNQPPLPPIRAKAALSPTGIRHPTNIVFTPFKVPAGYESNHACVLLTSTNGHDWVNVDSGFSFSNGSYYVKNANDFRTAHLYKLWFP